MIINIICNQEVGGLKPANCDTWWRLQGMGGLATLRVVSGGQ